MVKKRLVQILFHVTPEFRDALKKYTKNQSAFIREAVEEKFMRDHGVKIVTTVAAHGARPQANKPD